MSELLHWLQDLPAFWSVLLMAMLPILELRGAIPFGISVQGMAYSEAYLVSVLGNAIPVMPLLLLLGPIDRWIGSWGPGRRFLNWLFARTRRRGKLIERFKFWGLILFVGIPLPVTGAWTGVAAAYIFGVPVRRAFPAILLGICLAGIVVSIAWATGITIFTKLPVHG